MKVTLQRFGRNLRLVLMLEWLTLWPVWGALAVSSQRRDMVSKSSKLALARPRRRRRGSILGPFRNGRTYRQSGRKRQGWRGCGGGCKNRDFFKRTNHIKGAFAADMMARSEDFSAQILRGFGNGLENAPMRCLQDVFAWMTKRSPEPATHHHRHSGATPEASNLESRGGVRPLDSGSPPKRAHPGMTTALVLAGLALLAAASPASAQGKLDARY